MHICKEGLLQLCFPAFSLAEPTAAETRVEVTERAKLGVVMTKV